MSLTNLWDQFTARLPAVTLAAVLDIVLVAVLIYQVIMILRGRRAARILIGAGFVLAAYSASIWLELDLLRRILGTALPYSAFALIVLFQSEIRRFLARISPRGWRGFGGRLLSQEASQDIVLAVQELATHKIGALIVVESHSGLRTFVESGVPMDAELTSQLLLAIFHPGNPLHDGAVIIRENRISAAACFLPIATTAVARHFGTRHRAGIGITEESDCVSIIVSEEKGAISIARAGEIQVGVGIDTVARVLGIASPKRTAQSPELVAVTQGKSE